MRWRQRWKISASSQDWSLRIPLLAGITVWYDGIQWNIWHFLSWKKKAAAKCDAHCKNCIGRHISVYFGMEAFRPIILSNGTFHLWKVNILSLKRVIKTPCAPYARYSITEIFDVMNMMEKQRMLKSMNFRWYRNVSPLLSFHSLPLIVGPSSLRYASPT